MHRHVTAPAAVSVLIEAQERLGYGFRNPLYRAALAGELRLIELLPGPRIPASMLKPTSRPQVIVIGDDGGEERGPAGFPKLRKLLEWAAVVVLHSCGGEEHHYDMAVEAATERRRVLFIETATGRREAWAQRIGAEINRRHRAHLRQLHVLDIQIAPGLPAHPLVKAVAL
ncbi:hypothetical protein [Siccirubricoccus phaeus]|uniref:hypothetical protein n=1 Tax=Siccirubricoccus phaeus TaxID=2595053 RepID=UPI0011F2D21E|nr:hypothetical protein [Siccirubricoccus phaeus]